MDSPVSLSQIKELYEQYVVPTYGRFDLAPQRGQGCRVIDSTGREYLDFGSGIAVCSLGHSPAPLVEAISRQAAELIHTSNLYYISQQARLARRLVECTGLPGRIFFCNDGATANEALFKLARRYGHAVSGPQGGRHEILTFEGSFHGRTLAGIAATAQAKIKHGFEPATPGFRHVPFNDLNAAEKAITDRTAAVLLEPIQGEGGIHVATPEFLLGLARICRERNALLFFDEIQCGLGRTGQWCAWKSILPEELEPDGVSWAKGIAGGFPMGAVWISDRPRPLQQGQDGRLPDLLGPGSHGTTFGGAPLACAAALAVLKCIEEEDLLARAVALGARLRAGLESIRSPLIQEVRGIGLMLGLVLSDSFSEQAGTGADTPPALALVKRLQNKGLLTVPSGTHVIRFLPPLNVKESDVDEACQIVASEFAAMENRDL